MCVFVRQESDGWEGIAGGGWGWGRALKWGALQQVEATEISGSILANMGIVWEPVEARHSRYFDTGIHRCHCVSVLLAT